MLCSITAPYQQDHASRGFIPGSENCVDGLHIRTRRSAMRRDGSGINVSRIRSGSPVQTHDFEGRNDVVKARFCWKSAAGMTVLLA